MSKYPLMRTIARLVAAVVAAGVVAPAFPALDGPTPSECLSAAPGPRGNPALDVALIDIGFKPYCRDLCIRSRFDYKYP